MNNYLHALRYLLRLHLLGLALCSLLRLALFVAGRHFLTLPGESAGAFLRGVWLDNVVACYIAVVPLVLVTLAFLVGGGRRAMLRLARWWMVVLWSVCIGISAANIPYFLYFFKNLNSSIWNWAEYGTTTLGMLFGEAAYYPPMLAFVALVALLVWLSGRWLPRIGALPRRPHWLPLVLGFPLIGLCIFGIRGRMGYNPIKVSAAYYCDDAFLNQLGISPTFNLLTSTLDDRRPENRRLALTDEGEALAWVQQQLNCQGTEQQPLLRTLSMTAADSTYKNHNVVLILMESMSQELLGQGHTPFLDSLKARSIHFPNAYSAGNHTNHGIFATLYSYPALMFRNLMKGTYTPNYSGLPTVLKGEGYRTMFFMTHESQYDNMNAFLRTNGYEEIYSQENYPREKIANSFGVQDDFLYSYALGKLQNIDPQTPFLATLLSISNHPPFVIPDYFQPRSTKPEEQIVEYSDWSLQQFFNGARQQPWYEKTIFVLLGDHGKLLGQPDSEMPQSLNHIPLIIHIPGREAEVRQQWALQMDVQPTVLALLGIRAQQNNFGTDLMHEQRPCAFYTSDNLITARDTTHQFIYNPKTEQSTLLLNGKPTQQSDSTFQALQQYVFRMLQTTEYMIDNELTQ